MGKYCVGLVVFFFPTPPQLPPIKGDLRTLPDDVVNRFSKNIIIQFEKAKVYQMSLKELYSDRETIFYKGIMPSETGFRFSSGL